MCVTEIKADLFNQTDDSLVHCVSRDLRMGRGIAVEFRERFGQVEALRLQAKPVGEVAYIPIPGNRFAFYPLSARPLLKCSG